MFFWRNFFVSKIKNNKQTIFLLLNAHRIVCIAYILLLPLLCKIAQCTFHKINIIFCIFCFPIRLYICIYCSTLSFLLLLLLVIFLLLDTEKLKTNQRYKDLDGEIVRKNGIILLRELTAEVKNFMDFKMNAVLVSIHIYICTQTHTQKLTQYTSHSEMVLYILLPLFGNKLLPSKNGANGIILLLSSIHRTK